MAVILGEDVSTGSAVYLGDAERCGGLYLLGKPRTGKSTLLISLALQDMASGHGLLFIDPHSDAIRDLLARIPAGREKDVILLDPDLEEQAFGINPLTCQDPQSYKEITFSYGLARDVFVKVFGEPQTGELGILLDKYLRNSLYPLLENPGFTLLDIESFLIDKSFRNRLLKNVTMNPAVVRFWQEQFEQLPYKDQIAERESTLNRLNVILTQPYVKHIVGQVKTRVDFTRILKERKIVLLRMPAGMDEGIKTFIGTLIISQFLKAVWLRQGTGEEDRLPFAIYCDEFQHFATPDFAKLFTQTGKFKIMPTVAHQERLGQFRPQDPNRGATLAAPNKALFGLSAPDSKELSPEFAREPPTETRLEEQLVISQNPVYDLLRGHANPEVRMFVDKAIRPLQERLQDIKDDMEGERLIRTDLLDQAALDRLGERISSVHARGRTTASILGRAVMATELARQQTGKMQDLLDTGRNFRQAVREMNRFLTAVMEGKTSKGREDFSNFIVNSMRLTPLEPRVLQEFLEFYISLAYGDPKIRRQLPFALAKAHGLFSSTVYALEQNGEAKIKQERADFLKKQLDALEARRVDAERKARETIQQYKEEIRKEIDFWKLEVGEEFFRRPSSSFFSLSIPILEYSSVRDIVAPLLTARLAPPWSNRFPDIPKTLSWIRGHIKWFRNETEKALHYYYWHHPPSWTFSRRFRRQYPNKPDDDTTLEVFAPVMLDAFEKFIEQYKEGAIVALLVLATLGQPREWRKYRNDYNSDIVHFGYCIEKVYKYYWRFNMLYLPTVSGLEPLQVFLLLVKLGDTLSRLNVYKECKKYAWSLPKHYSREPGEEYRWPEFWGCSYFCPGTAFDGRYFAEEIEGLEGDDGYKPLYENKNDKKGYPGSLRCNLYMLNQKLRQSTDLLSRNQWWPGLENLIKTYLQSRAWDIAKYGIAVADKTFPQPTIKGASSGQVSGFVWQMAKIIEEEWDKVKAEKEKAWLARSKREIYEEHDKKFRNQLIPVPTHLESMIFSDKERREIVGALRKELGKNDLTKGALEVVDTFVRVCDLLAKPENHIKVKTGQFVEKEVNTRTFADMEVEMAWELVNLPKYTAYVKITQEQAGKQVVVKKKVRTYPLPSVPKGRDAQAMEKTILQQNYSLYYKKRRDIEEEIAMRQQKQLAPNPDNSPPTHIEGGQDSSPPAAAADTPPQGALIPSGDVPEPDEPPPPGFSNPKPAEAKEPVQPKTGNNPGEGNLIYQSNFYLPDDKWTEKETEDARKFRRDGYYHIELNRSYTTVELIEIPVTDFRVHVDAELLKGETVVYGVCFRCIKVSNGLSFHLFAFTPKSWGLLFYHNGNYKCLEDYRSCEFIRHNSINSLMVQMVGQRITLGVNGHILATVTDNCPTSGCVGLFMRKEGYSPAEVRFRDFRLYSLE